MKNLLVFSIIIILILGAYGVSKSLYDAGNYSMLEMGLSKDEVRGLLGKPIEIDHMGNEIYKVSVDERRRYEGATAYAILDFATLGIWEIVASKAEEQNYEKIAVVYDETDRSVGFLSETEYEFCSKVLALISEEWKKTDDESRYILLHFDEDKGWFFIDKYSIRCKFQQKYLKMYLKRIPTIQAVIDQVAQYELEDIPVYELQTVFFDPLNNTYTEKHTNYYNSEGEVLRSINNQEAYDWMEMYPDSLAKALYDVIALFCVNKYIEKHKVEKGPSLKDMI